MILRDSVEIIESSSLVPAGRIIEASDIKARYPERARVDYRMTKDEGNGTGDKWSQWRQSQNLVCMLPYRTYGGLELTTRRHNIKWRGTAYALDGEPMVHMRGSRPHHVTVALRAVQG